MSPPGADRRWLGLVYASDVTGTLDPARPALAAGLLAAEPTLAATGPYLACAAGNTAAVRAAIEQDPGWIDRPGGPLDLPPLLAVTHSSLLRLPQFRGRLHDCAQLLLEAGADPNQRIFSRVPPASLAAPDRAHPLSALYGAAGSNRDEALTRLLLDAGADPNDGESLYHSLEDPHCTRLLLAHGARIEGTNALYRALDLEHPDALALLLAHGGDPNEPARNRPLTDWGSPLLWAIRRRRSRRHVELLLDAGADPAARTPSGLGAYRLSLQFGLTEIAALLERQGAAEPLSELERFIAACARADEAAARTLLAHRPDLPGSLSAEQRRLLPDLVAEGVDAAARLMVALGWPVATPGGDWDASALNLAVFRGDAPLARFLLEHGAAWTERQGFGDDVSGTLSWACCNADIEGADWPGCARALLDHGMPAAPDRTSPDLVVIAGARKRFSDDVRDVLLRRPT